MRGSINMKGVEENGAYEVLPEGKYDLIIKEVSARETKDNHDPMANVMFEVERGDYQGSKLWDNIIFPNEGSPASKIKGRTRHFLHAIGEPYEDKENLPYDTENWIMKPVKVIVKHGSYQGKTQARIDEYIIDETVNDDSQVPF